MANKPQPPISIHHGDSAISRQFGAIIEYLKNLTKFNPLINVHPAVSFTLASGDNEIPHGLARTVAGYIVVDSTAAVTHYRKESATPTATTILNVSAATTLSIIFF